MSYGSNDAAQDEFYEELHREIREKITQETIQDGLRTQYLGQSQMMCPAFNAFHEARRLYASQHYEAATVFQATAMEQFLKAVLLKPLVSGLVKHPALADVVVQSVMNGTSGFDRYFNLLGDIFKELLSLDIRTFRLPDSNELLIKRCNELQKMRNGIVHRGESCSVEFAGKAEHTTAGVCNHIVNPLFLRLQLGTTRAFLIVDKSQP